MNFVKRINRVGWLMLGIGLVWGLQYFIPSFDRLLEHPSPLVTKIGVIFAAFCFGVYGIDKPTK